MASTSQMTRVVGGRAAVGIVRQLAPAAVNVVKMQPAIMINYGDISAPLSQLTPVVH